MRELGEAEPPSDEAAWTQLKRMGLVRAGCLTLSGLLLFGTCPYVRPQFSLKAVYFSGENVTSSRFLDSEHYEGRLQQLFSGAVAFLRRNLRKL
jgi:ATP-dependent DNA helicase RecG